ncbi:hypothetical protein RLEG3_06115 (plasmid) [Rhizobium leguminosarum bv. trifolii WSM1689]|nr:hypothetical protein RLEG3_06115 [Rhizobium leguminosarum bv. trifolii WSM1689]
MIALLDAGRSRSRNMMVALASITRDAHLLD